MYCQELDRLLDQHSALTMELFQQDGRTQGWYHTLDEWERECAKLRAMEEELERLIAALAAHRRQHGCVSATLGLTMEGAEDNDAGKGTALIVPRA